MKMTMHIDEDLLERVIEAHGFTSKTEAVEMALREMDRKHRFKKMVKEGIGLSPDELSEGVEPGYDVLAMRAAEAPSAYRRAEGGSGGSGR
jgi:hypothetical protein